MACHGREVGRLGSDRAGFFEDDPDRVAHLLFGVLGGQEEAQPRRAFRYRRIEDRLDIDAAAEQRLREPRGADRAPGNDRHDRGAD